MSQTHERFTTEQVRFLYGACVHGRMNCIEVQVALAIEKSCLSRLLREGREAPQQAAEGPSAGPALLAGFAPGVVTGSRRMPRRRSRVVGGTSWAGRRGRYVVGGT